MPDKPAPRCPYCGGEIHIMPCDGEGNHRDDDYAYDPWSGLWFYLSHTEKDVPPGEECPIAHYDDAQLGIWLWDNYDEAYAAAMKRCEGKGNDAKD